MNIYRLLVTLTTTLFKLTDYDSDYTVGTHNKALVGQQTIDVIMPKLCCRLRRTTPATHDFCSHLAHYGTDTRHPDVVDIRCHTRCLFMSLAVLRARCGVVIASCLFWLTMPGVTVKLSVPPQYDHSPCPDAGMTRSFLPYRTSHSVMESHALL